MEGKDTAFHIWVSELANGILKQVPDGPSALLANDRALNRVMFFGVVVSPDLFVDDGTGSVLVRAFNQHLNINIGDCVLVIGRPRIYDKELYVLGEIVKKVDASWLSFWRRKYPLPAKINSSARVLDVVRKKDAGDGADYDSVVSELGDKGEELIIHMLATGELFETKPGKLKVLD